MEFETRYKKLNDAQRQAVDTIDGPLLVIAGPGTGKTELLSMRAANILKQTDTLPENILCLTFTDSGAHAMRARLASIVGPEAYKVAIHTFHSFGTEVINQNKEYFYHGADFEPADDLTRHQILTGIFDELDYTSPLAGKMETTYSHLSDTMRVISELKQAGLTSDELLGIIAANDEVLGSVERELSDIFAQKISTSMLSLLVPLAKRVANVSRPHLAAGVTPLANILALSMAHAFDEAVATNKTTPITAWRNRWLEKNADGIFVFKDRKRHEKLRAVSHIYFSYLTRMEQHGYYDYDDMILQVVHAVETQPELRFNLQEKYHYIMVDEFQDTNLAQLRILFELMDPATNDGQPNIMAVGDDDQAIYSFQGADVNNIYRFRETYPSLQSIVLTDNYRSPESVLVHAREVITQGDGRLETTMNISKHLTAHHAPAHANASLHELPNRSSECAWIAESIATQIASGTPASGIAVLARRHSELLELLPYLHHHNITVNYERRDNILELTHIQTLELIATIVVAIADGRHDEADALLPELIAHPMYDFEPEAIWRLSLTSHRNHISWLETMMTLGTFKPLAEWLIVQAAHSVHDTLEQSIDRLIGIPTEIVGEDVSVYKSPFYEYYFSSAALEAEPDAYLLSLDALRTLRDRLRSYTSSMTAHLGDLVDFLELYRSMGSGITSVRQASSNMDGSVTLMTVHKAKGLEFDTVYIPGSIDSTWGERVRSRSRLISYPENLEIAPAGDSYDERLRLYFVAMTRAKRRLVMSYAVLDNTDKGTLVASFLTGTSLTAVTQTTNSNQEAMTALSLIAWHERLTAIAAHTMQQLLASTLENYKLSTTHLGNFIDVTRGGPMNFLMTNLLHFPSAKSPQAQYGTAIHAALQRAHTHLTVTGERRPIEDVLGDFETELTKQHMTPEDHVVYSKRGAEALSKFLAHMYASFTKSQRTELSFAGQGAIVGNAHLTGSLDLVDIVDRTIHVTDYKTGKPSRDWKGTTDYEKIKLHKYRQQLLFYELLVEHSRDYGKFTFAGGTLQFIEPDRTGVIHALESSFTSEEKIAFTKLLNAVWHCITSLELPDISEFDSSYKGILAFEQWLIDKYS